MPLKKQLNLHRLTFSAVSLALCIVLPFITGQVPEIGNMLCPMHIPVLLCGFICGWQYGAVVGFVAPLLRSFLVGAPPLFPQAVSMAFEIAVYGLMTGLLSRIFPKKNIYIYINLVISMLSGRLVWGAVRFLLYGLGYTEFSLKLFFAGAFLEAIPGIIIQLILVPVIVIVLRHAKSKNFTG